MLVIKNKIIPFGNYKIFNFCGLILFVKADEITKKEYNHERIHSYQILEMFIVGFYLWYALEYLLIRLFHRKQTDAYHDVSFEEEAYNNDENLGYLTERRLFSYRWRKYIRIKSNKVISEK